MTGSDVGPLNGWVALTGPTGTTRVCVTANISGPPEPPRITKVETTPAPPTPVASATSAQRLPDDSRPPSTGAVTPFETAPEPPSTERGMALPTFLLAMAAAAVVMAYLLPPADYTGLFSPPNEDPWWLVMPAAVILIAIPALFDPRTHPVALGMTVGCTAWAGAFCLKQAVSGLAAEGMRGTAQAWLESGAWPRVAAFLLLAVAAGMLLVRSAGLVAPLMMAKDGRALAAAALVLLGASVPLAQAVYDNDVVPRATSLSIAVAALCLPVAVSRLRAVQRPVMLTAVTAFLMLTWGRDIWVVLTSGISGHLASTSIGLLLILAGCYLGGARRDTRLGAGQR